MHSLHGIKELNDNHIARCDFDRRHPERKDRPKPALPKCLNGTLEENAERLKGKNVRLIPYSGTGVACQTPRCHRSAHPLNPPGVSLRKSTHRPESHIARSKL